VSSQDDRSPVRLYKRGHVYWTWYYDRNGSQVRVSTKRTTERAARQEARRIEEAAAGCAPARPTEPYPLAAALERLLDEHDWAQLTLNANESRANKLSEWIGDVDVAALDRKTLEDYIDGRCDEDGLSMHSIFKEMVLVRLALKLAKADGRWDGIVADVVPTVDAEYKPRERWMTVKEAKALRKQLEAHRRLWLNVALYSGARKSEVETLAWADVDFDLGVIRVRGTKTEDADRTIPLAGELRAILERAKKKHRVGTVVAAWGNVIRDLKAACRRAGIEPVTPNDCRRTLASWMAQAGVPERHIAEWLGHGSEEMVRRVYAKVNPATLKAAAAVLPSLGRDNCVIARSTSKRQNRPAAATSPLRKQRAWRESNPRPLASEARGNVVPFRGKAASGAR
jgi:integrase